MSRYRKDYRIGVGGMGEVFRVARVLHNGEEGPVACKVMRGKVAMDEKCVRLFHREAKLGLAVANDDPNVVSVYDYLAHTAPNGEQTFYLIMEFVEGVDLETLVRVRERLSFDMLRCIARDILSGLRYLHSRGVLHRDLSPSNVLVSVAGTAKVADFGVAAFVKADGLQSQSIHGKFAYLAPEMGVGQPIDCRTDLFAFGATIYHLLAGVAPLGETVPEIIGRRAEWRIDALPTSVPEDLRAVVTGLLKRVPSERKPQTADEALAMIAEPVERGVVTAGLGEIVGELYARKLKRWHRHQSEQAKVAESEEYIEAESVLEGFADTVRSGGEATGSDEERYDTEVVGDDSWRTMRSETVDAADTATEAAQGKKANSARETANRPRLALGMLLAIVAVIALAIKSDVRIDGDQTPSIAWQLIRPPEPRDEWMPAPGEERARRPTPAPESESTTTPGEERAGEPGRALNSEPTPAPDEERAGEPFEPKPAIAEQPMPTPATRVKTAIRERTAKQPRPVPESRAKTATGEPVPLARPSARDTQTAQGMNGTMRPHRAPPRLRTIVTAPATSAQLNHSQPYRGPGSTWSMDWVYMR